MTRYYFYSADMFQDGRQSGVAGIQRVGDYQGVYSVDDDTLTPDQVFMQLVEALKGTIPAELTETTYYHVTQFNSVT